MSHEEERVNGVRIRDNRDRAPPHWLNPLVELSRCAANTLQHRTAYGIPISNGRNTGLQISDQAAPVVADCFMLDVFREMW